jgi:DNA-binding response OmpR family regulator
MRILLIEDEPEVAKFIEDGLRRERFAVDTVDDGKLGLYQACVTTYDLILCDYMLPHRNGINLAQELRGRSVGTPFLMLTVVDDLDTKVRALNAGADDFLCKPFAFDELIARIRALMRREANWRSEYLSVGNLEMWVTKHLVKRAGQTINLSRKEFMLLEFLMRHADVVVSRNQILEHVWDNAVEPLTNSVEVHIRYLRKKIDEPWGRSERLIHTVHGVGYKITADGPEKFNPYPSLGKNFTPQ